MENDLFRVKVYAKGIIVKDESFRGSPIQADEFANKLVEEVKAQKRFSDFKKKDFEYQMHRKSDKKEGQ
jgi:hypothetical protein